MFQWLKPSAAEAKSFEEISAKFGEMLDDGRHTFDAAANALLGGTDPEVIREDLFATDERINRTEQKIRRQLVVHGSVHGSVGFPSMLVLMSLVKDAERIGDYNKNLFDLAVVGHENLLHSELAPLVDAKDRISKLLVRARNIYASQDTDAANGCLADCDGIEDECDAAVRRLLVLQGENAAATVLTYRYFKRIVSHTANIVTSLVMPLDKLDFFDEPKV